MKILIVEDEARILKRLQRMIQEIFSGELDLLLTADSLESGLQKMKNASIDLLFLDLNLNGLDGFQILEEVVAESFHTIIVSAYKDRAIEAFEYGVLDFVPKPFDIDRLTKACKRIKIDQKGADHLKFLSVKKAGKRQLIAIDEVLYIQGAGIYSEIYLRNGRKEIHNKSLDALGVLLPSYFERIHKSYLCSMKEADHLMVEPGSKYSLKLKDNKVLPIGRTRYKDISKKWFT